jgi:hypothetical protein
MGTLTYQSPVGIHSITRINITFIIIEIAASTTHLRNYYIKGTSHTDDSAALNQA